MPRHPDPDLEDRILKAAHRLWQKGGEKSLTMRAVARAAGTNTPAVYRRFKDRHDLVRGLLRGAACFFKHLRRHLYADNPPCGAGLLCGDQTVHARTATDIDHALARFHGAGTKRVARAGERHNALLGDAIKPGFIVLEHSRERTAGMEVKATARVDGNSSILVLNGMAQLADIW